MDEFLESLVDLIESATSEILTALDLQGDDAKSLATKRVRRLLSDIYNHRLSMPSAVDVCQQILALCSISASEWALSRPTSKDQLLFWVIDDNYSNDLDYRRLDKKMLNDPSAFARAFLDFEAQVAESLTPIREADEKRQRLEVEQKEMDLYRRLHAKYGTDATR